MSDTPSWKSSHQGVAGTWGVEESSAEFTISFVDGQLQIEGHSTNSGERFVITDVSWDGTRLSGTFLMPSTNHSTESHLDWTEADRLRGEYCINGQAAGPEVWYRKGSS